MACRQRARRQAGSAAGRPGAGGQAGDAQRRRAGRRPGVGHVGHVGSQFQAVSFCKVSGVGHVGYVGRGLFVGNVGYQKQIANIANKTKGLPCWHFMLATNSQHASPHGAYV